MKYIKLFETFLIESRLTDWRTINETLKSDKIEIAFKKLDNFFSKMGLNKKSAYSLSDAISPYYQIITDRQRYKEQLIDQLKRYREYSNDPTISPESKKIYLNQIPDIEKQLDKFNYNDYETIVINTDFNSKELSLELISLINSMGYHIVSVGTWRTQDQNRANKYDAERRLMDSNKIKLLAIQPNYGDRVEFRGEYLYHTTDSKYLDKILKYGLVPKSKNSRFFYPGRIFLSPSKEFSDVLKNSLISHSAKKELDKFSYDAHQKLVSHKENEWIDLRIKNFKGLTLYRDMMLPSGMSLEFPEGGFFTYDNIPPEYIEVIPKNSGSKG